MRHVRLPFVALPGMDRLAVATNTTLSIEWRLTLVDIIVLGIIAAVGVAIYKSGKREGSRKGFGVGRYGRK